MARSIPAKRNRTDGTFRTNLLKSDFPRLMTAPTPSGAIPKTPTTLSNKESVETTGTHDMSVPAALLSFFKGNFFSVAV